MLLICFLELPPREGDHYLLDWQESRSTTMCRAPSCALTWYRVHWTVWIMPTTEASQAEEDLTVCATTGCQRQSLELRKESGGNHMRSQCCHFSCSVATYYPKRLHYSKHEQNFNTYCVVNRCMANLCRNRRLFRCIFLLHHSIRKCRVAELLLRAELICAL